MHLFQELRMQQYKQQYIAEYTMQYMHTWILNNELMMMITMQANAAIFCTSL